MKNMSNNEHISKYFDFSPRIPLGTFSILLSTDGIINSKFSALLMMSNISRIKNMHRKLGVYDIV